MPLRSWEDLSARPLRDRRARLEDIVAGGGLVFPVRRVGGRRAGGVEPGGRARVTLTAAPPGIAVVPRTLGINYFRPNWPQAGSLVARAAW